MRKRVNRSLWQPEVKVFYEYLRNERYLGYQTASVHATVVQRLSWLAYERKQPFYSVATSPAHALSIRYLKQSGLPAPIPQEEPKKAPGSSPRKGECNGNCPYRQVATGLKAALELAIQEIDRADKSA